MTLSQHNFIRQNLLKVTVQAQTMVVLARNYSERILHFHATHFQSCLIRLNQDFIWHPASLTKLSRSSFRSQRLNHWDVQGYVCQQLLKFHLNYCYLHLHLIHHPFLMFHPNQNHYHLELKNLQVFCSKFFQSSQSFTCRTLPTFTTLFFRVFLLQSYFPHLRQYHCFNHQ